MREGCFPPLAFFFAFPMHSFKLAQTTYVQGKPEVSCLLSGDRSPLLSTVSLLTIYIRFFLSVFPWRGGSGVSRDDTSSAFPTSAHMLKKTLCQAGFDPGLPKGVFLPSNLVSITVSSPQHIHKYSHVETLSSPQTTKSFRPTVFICCP